MNSINRIVLVGNGFDLAHNLDTKYESFIKWYWEQWNLRLLTSVISEENDGLCHFKLNGEFKNSRWYVIWTWHYVIRNEDRNHVVDIAKNDSSLCEFQFDSLFFKNICNRIEDKGWVDIENGYYNALNNEYKDIPEVLNKEFEIVRLKLIEYLNFIQETKIIDSIIEQNIKKIILSPIDENEIAIANRSQFIDFVRGKLYDSSKLCNDSINDYRDLKNRNLMSRACESFLEKNSWQINNFGFESLIGNVTFPKEILYPCRLMLLNFNYTTTADLYIPVDEGNSYWFQINHIHGELKNPDSVIFGYGDELDDKYKDIVKLNNNEHLRNIKSVKYLETNNYRKMLDFIESAPYQIYIMGHSCGNSDRTLLNTLFEHKNCVSIKPFYYIKEDGTDNYLDLVQNISRNFTDMKLMRDRVVNKTYCEPLVDYSKKQSE